jgi:hypothetical protein
MIIVLLSALVLALSLVTNRKAAKLFSEIGYSSKKNYLIVFLTDWKTIIEKVRTTPKAEKELNTILIYTLIYIVGFIYVFVRIIGFD